ncbi:MAG: hypothetical protein M1817_003658 [Caeruleum heppii]|nr:MAG: hypothetical protein M1817_003658 [Caeruleum heppii]
MSEYIGSRISLLSKSDIRYVGVLHEINSESSTVALEQVTSFGTEGRRNNPEDEIAPSDSIYEYIVFRGSDVKDLRIEDTPTKENKKPQVPDDPAILGSGSRPPPAKAPAQPSPAPTQSPQPPLPGPHQFQPHGHHPYFYPPPGGRGWGPYQGPPPGPGFPGMPYGAPPGWFPPPGQGFPQHPGPGPFPHSQTPPGPPGQQFGQKPPPGPPGPPAAAATNEPKPEGKERPIAQKGSSQPPAQATAPSAAAEGPKQPPLPLESKPDVATALAPTLQPKKQAPAGAQSAARQQRGGRIGPAVPLPGQGRGTPQSTNGPAAANGGKPTAPSTSQPSHVAASAALQSATQAATAAVAAAMAKLPPAPGPSKGQSEGIDNLTQKVSEMRTNEHARTRGPAGEGRGGHRGGRGRGNVHQAPARKVEVPKTDYDFASANAKFNKQDMVKEAIASGSPISASTENNTANGQEATTNGKVSASEGLAIPPTTYNKVSSFFDNISSEAKDRTDTHGPRPGGREWRGEEQKKNVETFGQGSVDNGYRGGFRGGRGRGRGFGGRGRGGPSGGRGGRGGYRGAGNGPTGVVAGVPTTT